MTRPAKRPAVAGKATAPRTRRTLPSVALTATGNLIRIALPMPKTRNTSADRHWSHRAKATTAYYQRCANAVALMGLVLPRGWLALTADAECHVRNEHDEGNLMARLKPLEDWIVRQGVVAHDKPAHWHWPAMPRQVIQRSYPELVVLTLRRCDALHARSETTAAFSDTQAKEAA